MRYARLFLLQVRLSLVLAMQYRWEFLVESALSLVWTAVSLVPLYVAFHARPPVSGWTFERALVVVGHFTLLKAMLEGAVNPSLVSVVQRIRQGTLDFLLLKPADAQFLVSTAKFEPYHAVDALAALAIFAFAFRKLGETPSAGAILLSAAMLGGAALVLYAMWVLVVSAAFWVVRLDNLAYFFNAMLDFARWPVQVMRGAWAFVFTFVIPVGILTTYPAEALLGALDTRTALVAAAVAAALSILARLVWLRAIRQYTSASS